MAVEFRAGRATPDEGTRTMSNGIPWPERPDVAEYDEAESLAKTRIFPDTVIGPVVEELLDAADELLGVADELLRVPDDGCEVGTLDAVNGEELADEALEATLDDEGIRKLLLESTPVEVADGKIIVPEGELIGDEAETPDNRRFRAFEGACAMLLFKSAPVDDADGKVEVLRRELLEDEAVTLGKLRFDWLVSMNVAATGLSSKKGGNFVNVP